MLQTAIRWTNSTWNPLRGCKEASPGCRNCYAKRIAGRFAEKGQTYYGIAKLKNGEPVWTGKVQWIEEHALDPLDWSDRNIYTASMSDLFYPGVKNEQRDQVFGIMCLGWKHQFQLSTKYAEEMREYFAAKDVWARIEAYARSIHMERYGCLYPSNKHLKGPLKHLWLGVSVEDQAAADKRVAVLQKIPAALRFVLAEPLLGPINFAPWVKQGPRMIDWIVVSGESGAGARPMDPAWVRSIQGQCRRAKVPFFLQQWGAWQPIVEPSILQIKYPNAPLHKWESGETMLQLPFSTAKAMSEAGWLLDGREWAQIPPEAIAAWPKLVPVRDGVSLQGQKSESVDMVEARK